MDFSKASRNLIAYSKFLEQNLHYLLIRGGSRGRVQGVHTPPWDDLRLSDTTGILQKKSGLLVSVTPFLSGAPPSEKNPWSAPVNSIFKVTISVTLQYSAWRAIWLLNSSVKIHSLSQSHVWTLVVCLNCEKKSWPQSKRKFWRGLLYNCFPSAWKTLCRQ